MAVGVDGQAAEPARRPPGGDDRAAVAHERRHLGPGQAQAHRGAEPAVLVVLEELVVGDDDDPDADEPSTEATDTVRVQLTRAQVSSFIRSSRELVASGRPPCRFCGLPVDPDGHPCPRMN
jgi:uncharacterized repeat protein (TIGR03847 family)